MSLSEYKIKDKLIKNRDCMQPRITCHAKDDSSNIGEEIELNYPYSRIFK
ncbi:hypothetical protein KHQ82_09270 [Mycoplasmatota bacterium]|nr:hypothetical protein KHQ82_09270 [Mycoplasmatota bacterium]